MNINKQSIHIYLRRISNILLINGGFLSNHGMKTFICDGTYLQLQDTEDIKQRYAVKEQAESYPQALLEIMIRQGTGQISQFVLGSRQQSKLFLVMR
jgi:hypothetical protein